jgi:DNA-binding response OmpR family regulator
VTLPTKLLIANVKRNATMSVLLNVFLVLQRLQNMLPSSKNGRGSVASDLFHQSCGLRLQSRIVCGSEGKETTGRSHGKVLELLWDCCGMTKQEKRAADSVVYFGACQLYVRNVQLWRDSQEVKLTGKAFAVLSYFVQHPGQKDKGKIKRLSFSMTQWPDDSMIQ